MAKVMLGAGRQARIRFGLDGRSLSYWDADSGGWRVAPGGYRVMVGSSSRDLPLRGGFARGGARCPASAR
jgi:beta-glucosidase